MEGAFGNMAGDLRQLLDPLSHLERASVTESARSSASLILAPTPPVNPPWCTYNCTTKARPHVTSRRFVTPSASWLSTLFSVGFYYLDRLDYWSPIHRSNVTWVCDV